MAATEEGTTTPNGEPNNLSAAECTTRTRTTSDYDQDSNYDTLGLRWEDEPREGGVLPNAEVSIEGGVSAITTPEHYVPLAQIKVPQNQEVMINNNKPIVSNSIIEETSFSSTHANATICSTITYEERIDIAKRYLQAGLKVRFNDGACMFLIIISNFQMKILPLTHNIKYYTLSHNTYQRHLVVANLILLHPASPQAVHN